MNAQASAVTKLPSRRVPNNGLGRPKGARNKATRELREFARQFTEAAVTELFRIATKGRSEIARVQAIRELLDRGHGKAVQPLSDPNGDGPALVILIDKQDDKL